jgi:hypothetical protein
MSVETPQQAIDRITKQINALRMQRVYVAAEVLKPLADAAIASIQATRAKYQALPLPAPPAPPTEITPPAAPAPTAPPVTPAAYAVGDFVSYVDADGSVKTGTITRAQTSPGGGGVYLIDTQAIPLFTIAEWRIQGKATPPAPAAKFSVGDHVSQISTHDTGTVKNVLGGGRYDVTLDTAPHLVIMMLENDMEKI